MFRCICSAAHVKLLGLFILHQSFIPDMSCYTNRPLSPGWSPHWPWSVNLSSFCHLVLSLVYRGAEWMLSEPVCAGMTRTSGERAVDSGLILTVESGVWTADATTDRGRHKWTATHSWRKTGDRLRHATSKVYLAPGERFLIEGHISSSRANSNLEPNPSQVTAIASQPASQQSDTEASQVTASQQLE